ncbi:hypothetical protein D7X32_21800 [Corallococcus carmarthensis]|uniref:Uncharacterized protein n=1 Tax=Corallococcus carmarthensis TaxID=2316728 RepID=A0A3A8K9I7_9BACT|nr:hypothetical protein D7X32_21800 [Corallococcus carmarthensis]
MDVSRAAAVFARNPDFIKVVPFIQAEGATRLEAEKLAAYIPVAFGMPLVRSLGARPPDTVRGLRRTQALVEVLVVIRVPPAAASGQVGRC